MKTKTSSKKIGLLGCALVALNVFAPPVAEALLDNPFQTVVAPQSGTTVVDFSGTFFLESNQTFFLEGVQLSNPFDLSLSNSLTSTFTAEFLAFLNSPAQPFIQTFAGLVFDVSVPAGTPPGLYQFDPNTFVAQIEIVSQDGGFPVFQQDTFGVLVTPVPDRGPSILLLGLSLATLCSFHAFKRLSRREC
jgi:hypothetical protein